MGNATLLKTADLSQTQKPAVPKNYQVKITKLVPGSEGERVGLLPNDLILTYNQIKVLSVNHLIQLVTNKQNDPGPIEITINRLGTEKTLQVKPGKLGAHISNVEVDTRALAEQAQENPLLRSGLALAWANEGVKGKKQADGSDGIFTALEALGLNLEGTRLVVLSACETGVGKVQTGEGVYGLRRAFQEAGAHAVLSTLWSVSDEGTQQLMQNFYNRFLTGEAPQKALRTIQLEAITSQQWNHPYYWAPFVMVGRE
ncbi:CHAT domain-containing protein [bacterium]|nr:CHAT domain-containing protein [bacterium]